MSSRSKRAPLWGIVVSSLVCACSSATPRQAHVLRVCADPNNLPFSNVRGEGFENRIAELVGRELGKRVEYTWWAQRRGFVRNTLKAGTCDVIMGVPAHYELTATTQPYYRSSYVFVTRLGGPNVRSFDDSVLRTVSVGVQLIGDDFANTPPAHALTRRGIIQNVRGYTVYGDYRQPNPPARIVDAVARGDVDVAIVWGPLAGYFATREGVPLRIAPITSSTTAHDLPVSFDIAMGVRRADSALKQKLNTILTTRRPAIDSILRSYGVPRADLPQRVVLARDS